MSSFSSRGTIRLIKNSLFSIRDPVSICIFKARFQKHVSSFKAYFVCSCSVLPCFRPFVPVSSSEFVGCFYLCICRFQLSSLVICPGFIVCRSLILSRTLPSLTSNQQKVLFRALLLSQLMLSYGTTPMHLIYTRY